MMLIIIRLPDTYSSASQRRVLVAACLPSVHSLSTFSVQLIVISEHFDNNISTIMDVDSRLLTVREESNTRGGALKIFKPQCQNQ